MQDEQDNRDPINDDGQGEVELAEQAEFRFAHYAYAIRHYLYVAERRLGNSKKGLITALSCAPDMAQCEKECFAEDYATYVVLQKLAEIFDQYVDKRATEEKMSSDDLYDKSVDPEIIDLFIATYKGKMRSTQAEVIKSARKYAKQNFPKGFADIVFDNGAEVFVRGYRSALDFLSPFPLSPTHNQEVGELLRIHGMLRNSYGDLADTIHDTLVDVRDLKGLEADVAGLGYNIGFDKVIKHFIQIMEDPMESFANLTQEEFERQMSAPAGDGQDYADSAAEMTPAYYEVLGVIEERLEALMEGLKAEEDPSEEVQEFVNETVAAFYDDCEIAFGEADEEAILEGVTDALYWMAENFPRITAGNDYRLRDLRGIAKAMGANNVAAPLTPYMM